jgi:hypothetical protein
MNIAKGGRCVKNAIEKNNEHHVARDAAKVLRRNGLRHLYLLTVRNPEGSGLVTKSRERAEKLRQSTLEQLPSGGFAEYFEPFTGEPLGSPDQSWTAAVALDF